jgi:uncharacterized protein YbjT (DUF2867 family)
MAAVDVAEGVAIAAVGDPVNGITEIGGPEAVRLPDLIRTALTARGDTREVVADPTALPSRITPDSGEPPRAVECVSLLMSL